MDVESKILQPEILSVDELTVLLKQVVIFVKVALEYSNFIWGDRRGSIAIEFASPSKSPLIPSMHRVG